MTRSKYPLATFVLLAYNHEEFVEEAVLGALSQTYSPLQIIFSDDSSSDATFDTIREIVSKYDGPHEVIINRNVANMGIGSHINMVMEMAAADFIIVAAGDDISDRDRVAVVMAAFTESDSPPYSIWSAARYIDAAGSLMSRRFPGNLSTFTDRSMVQNLRPVIGATHAWRREVFDFFGPLLPGVVFEDNAISFRSYLLGEVKYLTRELVSYRSHGENITNFAKIDDARVLYSAAAKRASWALIGLNQRRRDLETWLAKAPVPSRDYRFLSKELMRMEGLFKRRLKFYTQFPKLSLGMFFYSLRDAEIAKVLFRALLCRIAFV